MLIIEDTFIFVFFAIDIYVEKEKYNRDKITFTLIVLMNFCLVDQGLPRFS